MLHLRHFLANFCHTIELLLWTIFMSYEFITEKKFNIDLNFFGKTWRSVVLNFICVLFIFSSWCSNIFAGENYWEKIANNNIDGAHLSIDSLINIHGETAELLFAKAQCYNYADSAVSIYRQIYIQFPRDSFAAKSLLRLAEFYVMRESSNDIASIVYLLKDRFPKSPEYKTAKELLNTSKNVPDTKLTAKTSETSNSLNPKKNDLAPTQDSIIYTVQLGAFSLQNNALKIQSLADKIFTTDIVERQRDDKLFYVVLCGSFASKDQASDAVNKLEQAIGVKGYIVIR